MAQGKTLTASTCASRRLLDCVILSERLVMYSTTGIARMSHVLDGIDGGVSVELRGGAGALQK
jgi:hypothetical protein